MTPRIAITIGDFNGIGPEVTLKSLADPLLRREFRPLLIGPVELFRHYAAMFRLPLVLEKVESAGTKPSAGTIPVLPSHPVSLKQLQIGITAPDAGVCAGTAIEKAIALCMTQQADAMVTAPVSKEALHYAGYNFPGQTEMLALLTRSESVTMMLIAGSFRVALATVHVPVRAVSENLTVERIVGRLTTVDRALRNDLGVSSPRIAVLGLNPHAGENGAIGTEEKTIIAPAIANAAGLGIAAEGPFPADGFFGAGDHKRYDAVMAMYHDQGLIPLKMTGFDQGINFSAGLKIVRTSPDHGTAFGIAGKGTADPGSMKAAIRLAVSIAHQRKR